MEAGVDDEEVWPNSNQGSGWKVVPSLLIYMRLILNPDKGSPYAKLQSTEFNRSQLLTRNGQAKQCPSTM